MKYLVYVYPDGGHKRIAVRFSQCSCPQVYTYDALIFSAMFHEVTTAYGISDAKLEHALPEYDAVIIRSANRITRRMILSSPQLAAIGRAGSGVDNIDLEAACEFGVPVVNAPSGNARSVAGQDANVLQ